MEECQGQNVGRKLQMLLEHCSDCEEQPSHLIPGALASPVYPRPVPNPGAAQPPPRGGPPNTLTELCAAQPTPCCTCLLFKCAPGPTLPSAGGSFPNSSAAFSCVLCRLTGHQAQGLLTGVATPCAVLRRGLSEATARSSTSHVGASSAKATLTVRPSQASGPPGQLLLLLPTCLPPPTASRSQPVWWKLRERTVWGPPISLNECFPAGGPRLVVVWPIVFIPRWTTNSWRRLEIDSQ